MLDPEPQYISAASRFKWVLLEVVCNATELQRWNNVAEMYLANKWAVLVLKQICAYILYNSFEYEENFIFKIILQQSMQDHIYKFWHHRISVIQNMVHTNVLMVILQLLLCDCCRWAWNLACMSIRIAIGKQHNWHISCEMQWRKQTIIIIQYRRTV